MAKNKLLLIGGDGSINHTLAMLSNDGYHVITAQDYTGLIDIVRQEDPDVIILDIALSQAASSTCQALRQVTDAPIILLADNADLEDLIKSLDMGADGYMSRPFGYRELAARIKALLRRVQMQSLAPKSPREAPVLRVNDLIIDLNSYRVICSGTPVKLSRIEFNLLSFLIRSRGVVFSREQLLEKLWGHDYDGDARTVDTHIWSLRQKIEADPARPKHLMAVRGLGYKFE